MLIKHDQNTLNMHGNIKDFHSRTWCPAYLNDFLSVLLRSDEIVPKCNDCLGFHVFSNFFLFMMALHPPWPVGIYLPMHICMKLYMYIYVHIYVYAYIYIYMNTRSRSYAFVHTYICIYMLYRCVCMHICMYIYVHIYIYIYVYLYSHGYMY